MNLKDEICKREKRNMVAAVATKLSSKESSKVSRRSLACTTKKLSTLLQNTSPSTEVASLISILNTEFKLANTALLKHLQLEPNRLSTGTTASNQVKETSTITALEKVYSDPLGDTI